MNGYIQFKNKWDSWGTKEFESSLEIEYCHWCCQIPIVHCDLKPSNVLLDDEMVGHIGDFGLARLLFDTTQDSSIDHSSSIGVRGSIGYTPPSAYHHAFLNLIFFTCPIIFYHIFKLERTSLTGILYCS